MTKLMVTTAVTVQLMIVEGLTAVCIIMLTTATMLRLKWCWVRAVADSGLKLSLGPEGVSTVVVRACTLGLGF